MTRISLRYIVPVLSLVGIIVTILLIVVSFERRQSGKNRRILIVAIDGFNWDIAEPMLAQKRMPNLKKLMDGGGWAQTNIPIDQDHLWSPIIWTTILTGTTMDQHGIDNLYSIVDGRLLSIPVSSMRRTKAIWNILGENEIRSSFVSFLVTWPAEKIDGDMISCYAIPWAFIKNRQFLGRRDFFSRYENPLWLSSPPDLASLIERRLPSGETIRAGMRTSGIPDFFPVERSIRERDGFLEISTPHKQRLIAAYGQQVDESDLELIKVLGGSGVVPSMMVTMDEMSTTLAEEYLHDPINRVVGVYLGGGDIFTHFYWPESNSVAGGIPPALIGYYSYLDQLVGRLLAKIEKDTTVYLLSDHGYRFDKEHQVTLHDQAKAVFVMSGDNVRKLGRIGDVSILNILPTILYELGLKKDRLMPGEPMTGYLNDTSTVEQTVKER